MSILFMILGAVKGFIGTVVSWFTTGNVKAKLIGIAVIAALIALFVLYGKYTSNAEKALVAGREVACLKSEVDSQAKEAKQTGQSIGVTDEVTKDNAGEKGAVEHKADQIAKTTGERVSKAASDERAKSLARITSLWDTYCLAGSKPTECQIKE